MSIPEYELRRTKRRTLSMEINREAKLIVHAPVHMPTAQIEAFIEAHTRWIAEKQEKAKVKIARTPELREDEITALKEKAFCILTEKTAYYAKVMGLSPARVRINSAKTRFGSCSAKGSINYSFRLMLYPEEAWDYIVVHELCHLRHFDHSKAFWQMVETHLPDYKQRAALLK